MPAATHAPLRIVQSRHNARVKQLRATLGRPSAELIGLEGLHLVEEALRSGLDVQTIFLRAGSKDLLATLGRSLSPAGAARLARVPELLAVSPDVLESAVTTETPQPIAALAVPPRFSLDDALGPYTAAAPAILMVVLAGLQDPGNVGAILRSAEALGATGILALPGTASVWNPKSLRASMGSAFRLPCISCSTADALHFLARHGIRSIAAVGPSVLPGRATHTPHDIDLSASTALWIGSEGAGLAPELIAACDQIVTIPCPGPVESLNAAVAAAILLYEAARQRGQRGQRVSDEHRRPV